MTEFLTDSERIALLEHELLMCKEARLGSDQRNGRLATQNRAFINFLHDIMSWLPELPLQQRHELESILRKYENID